MIQFPSDKFAEQPTTYSGGQILAGAEKYNSINGNNISLTNIPYASITNVSIGTAQIQDAAITNAKVYGIHADKIDVGQLVASQIGSGAITADKIASNAVTADKIAANSITASKIASNTITANEIAAYSITGANITGYNFHLTGEQSIDGGLTVGFYGSTDGLNVKGCIFAEFNNKLHMSNNLDMGEHNVDGANTVWAYTFGNRSDINLKKDIATRLNNLDTLKRLRAVEYKLKKDDTKHIGLIAQEAELVVPTAVMSDEEGIKGIDYSQIVSVLIGAVQELKAEVDALKTK